MRLLAPSAILATALAASASAQWDPTNAQWGKTDPTDIRVMTWNVQDGIATSENKTENLNSWTAIAHIIAGMKPDILILQETGDNGCSNCVDTVAELETLIGLLMRGGADPFLGGQVTAFVQAYDPTFDMPYVFVSTASDGFNRNIIVSRFPFADLNGDNTSQVSDLPFFFGDLYAPGGNGGIRGFQFGEIDLPDETYAGDLVIGNAHLKAGGSSSDRADRLEAAQNVVYYMDYFLYGAGTGTPDPNSRFFATLPTDVIDENTPIIAGGDWNEDESSNNRKGPADWLTKAQDTPGSDGPDRDRTDALFDDAREFFTNSSGTRGSSKLDYISWSNSIATLRRAFIFDSGATPSASMPPEVASYPFSGGLASGSASDHEPVIADFILPAAPPPPMCQWDLDGDSVVGASDLAELLGFWGQMGVPADFFGDGVGADDLAELIGRWGPCP